MLAHGTYTVLQIPDTPFSAVYWLRQASGFGMTLFFVLSGFVIHYNYRGLVLFIGDSLQSFWDAPALCVALLLGRTLPIIVAFVTGNFCLNCNRV